MYFFFSEVFKKNGVARMGALEGARGHHSEGSNRLEYAFRSNILDTHTKIRIEWRKKK